jgi:hypothetical protein
MALLLRWHVRFPAQVVRPGNQTATGTNLRGAFARAQEIANADGITASPATPHVDHSQQDALIRGIIKELTGLDNVNQITADADGDHCLHALNWPHWEGHGNPFRFQLQPGSLGNWSEAWTLAGQAYAAG